MLHVQNILIFPSWNKVHFRIAVRRPFDFTKPHTKPSAQNTHIVSTWAHKEKAALKVAQKQKRADLSAVPSKASLSRIWWFTSFERKVWITQQPLCQHRPPVATMKSLAQELHSHCWVADRSWCIFRLPLSLDYTVYTCLSNLIQEMSGWSAEIGIWRKIDIWESRKETLRLMRIGWSLKNNNQH